MKHRMSARLAVRAALLALLSPLLAVPVVIGGPAQAAVATSCKPAAPIYGVDRSGALQEWLGGSPAAGATAEHAPGTPATGWQGYTQVVAAGFGVVYTVSADGTLRWWRHLGAGTGAATWAPGSGTVVGSGWNIFSHVVAVGYGVLYGLLPDGRLEWFRHTGYLTPTGPWAVGGGTVVMSGLTGVTSLAAGATGGIYTLTRDGQLRWYQHNAWLTGVGGSTAWGVGSGEVIAQGWTGVTDLVSPGGGVLLAVRADGSVTWHNHLGAVGGLVIWAPGDGAVVPGLNLGGLTGLTADPTTCSGIDRSNTAVVRQVGAIMVAGRGLAPSEFSCLDNIAVRESGWSWSATSHSTPPAYGIPQSMPGWKMQASGPDWQTNPVTQIDWMLSYVKATYGSPCAAWTWWQAHSWY